MSDLDQIDELEREVERRLEKVSNIATARAKRSLDKITEGLMADPIAMAIIEPSVSHTREILDRADDDEEGDRA